ncbi:MAG: type II secretion system protein [Akkermansiaceae bacterium]
MKNNTTNIKKNRKGFTLIEVIAVLVLLGILTAVAVPKYIDMSEQAKIKAIEAGVAELNSREALQWGQNQLTGTNTAVDTALGDDYTVTPTSGTVTSIEFKDVTYGVSYTAATGIGPGVYTLGSEQ